MSDGAFAVQETGGSKQEGAGTDGRHSASRPRSLLKPANQFGIGARIVNTGTAGNNQCIDRLVATAERERQQPKPCRR